MGEVGEAWDCWIRRLVFGPGPRLGGLWAGGPSCVVERGLTHVPIASSETIEGVGSGA